mgnify:FL=1
MTIGERIHGLRKQKNMSQEELASLVGVTRQALSKWECDASAPEIEKVIALSQYFGVSTDYILLGKEPAAEDAQKETRNITPNSALAFCTVLAAAGTLIAYALANDGTNFLYWGISKSMWGILLQILGIGLFEMFYFSRSSCRKTQMMFWCINTWFVTLMPLIFAAGFAARYLPYCSLIYMFLTAGIYFAFNLCVTLVLAYIIKRK